MSVRFSLLYVTVCLFVSQTAVAQSVNVAVTVDATTTGYRVNEDFVGFSMEQYTLSTGYWGRLGSFWTGGTNGNARLKNLLANISNHSVIRLGGFTADDRMVWQNAPRGTSTNVRATYSDDTDKFFTFLAEIGWKGIYTINLPINTPANAVSEATYIMNKYSAQLHSLSLGNEPYLYAGVFRSTGYTPDSCMIKDYLPMYDAIKAANPAIPISGLDCGARKYYGAMNQRWNDVYTNAINNSGSSRPLAALNVHSYGLGNNSNTLSRDAAADTLLNFNNAPLTFKASLLPYVTQLAQAKNTPLRFSETSSAATGTADTTNVSHTYVSALWALQYLYTLAASGVNGVNFHSSGSSVYSAIDWGPSASISAYKIAPIYYGILAFVDGAKNQRLLTVTPSGSTTSPRASYFATSSDDGKTLNITLINKDVANTISTTVTIPDVTISKASSQTLRPTTSRYDYAANTYYANAQVAANGTFTKGTPTPVSLTGSAGFAVSLAPMTATVVTVETSSQRMYTLKTGNWTDPAVWSGNRVPNSSDVLELKHTVTIPANSTVYGLRVVYATGIKLQYGQNAQLKLSL
ncbi:hypothetical protein [Spirosoma agri]|uniref:Beta-glucuronidase C-terminal domain-containing protein n=1 Tax=Spirosoma agri TaxID=1987381 RepID=A0A6M0IL02_9BACT|nr:hypothetical protein [Spirosoma agri]NEU68071.1 hypothetical protein [Spirosoma agri]